MSLKLMLLSLAALIAVGAGEAVAANAGRPSVDRALNLIPSKGGAANASVGDRYHVRDVIVDADGTEHVRFDRTYGGLPVIGGDLVVHSRDGRYKSASFTQRAALNLSTRAHAEVGGCHRHRRCGVRLRFRRHAGEHAGGLRPRPRRCPAGLAGAPAQRAGRHDLHGRRPATAGSSSDGATVIPPLPPAPPEPSIRATSS